MMTGTWKVGRLILGGPAPLHRITIWRGREGKEREREEGEKRERGGGEKEG